MRYDKDSLGTRMKGYEYAAKTKLPRRLPVIIRLDGKAFHTYTKGCAKPFDDRLISLMDATAKHVCDNIQGAQIAYVQSDEITILVHNYKKLNSSAWFDNDIQKMASISAALASTYFTMNSILLGFKDSEGANTRKVALFDSRVFVVPEHDVVNNFEWRQQDAIRNSVQMVARCLYSHKECENKNVVKLKEMILAKNMDWDQLPNKHKRGRCIYKAPVERAYSHNGEDGDMIRNEWIIDRDIPIFHEDREFIARHLKVEES